MACYARALLHFAHVSFFHADSFRRMAKLRHLDLHCSNGQLKIYDACFCDSFRIQAIDNHGGSTYRLCFPVGLMTALLYSQHSFTPTQPFQREWAAAAEARVAARAEAGSPREKKRVAMAAKKAAASEAAAAEARVAAEAARPCISDLGCSRQNLA